jgi:hypothetical protein
MSHYGRQMEKKEVLKIESWRKLELWWRRVHWQLAFIPIPHLQSFIISPVTFHVQNFASPEQWIYRNKLIFLAGGPGSLKGILTQELAQEFCFVTIGIGQWSADTTTHKNIITFQRTWFFHICQTKWPTPSKTQSKCKNCSGQEKIIKKIFVNDYFFLAGSISDQFALGASNGQRKVGHFNGTGWFCFNWKK